MTEQDIVAQVVELARDLVPEYKGPLTTSTTLINDLDLDSLTRVDLLADVERKFGVHVPDNQIKSMLSIGDVARFVASQREG